MPSLSRLTVPDGTTYDFRALGIPYAQVDDTSTSVAFTAQIPGITEYYDGLMILLKNGVETSESGFTININNIGAKRVYSNMAAATAETTIFNISYTMLFIYDSTRISDGCWICYRGYYTSQNTIGYLVRTNASTRPTTHKFYRYRILFTSANGEKWVPANTSSSTNATASRTVNQQPIDPFGEIVYYSTTAAINADSNVSTANIWQQYSLVLGYSFNRTNAALELDYPASVYIKCTPQTNGSAIIDADTPYVQDLPTTADGKIYIYLGRAYDNTHIEMVIAHPVYWHDGTGIRLWTGAEIKNGKSAYEYATEGGYEGTEVEFTERLANIEGSSVTIDISSASPTITAQSNVRYVCGEVTSINIIPPELGICDVIFTSGTTPAVLTLPNTVKMPIWFDSTVLDTNTIYEINIVDGIYGAVMTWTI